MIRVALIGTVGLPACYGGFETLAENFAIYVEKHHPDIELTVYCSAKNYTDQAETYRGAKLRYLPFDANGTSSVIYDLASMIDAKRRGVDVCLILGVSGAIFIPVLKLGPSCQVICNTDGLEWKRDKWGWFSRLFLRFSERMAVRWSDHVVVDNRAIGDHVKQAYGRESETIAYGGDHAVETEAGDISDLHLPGTYALSLCRIEPENNVGLILRAFSQCPERDLVFVGNWAKSAYGQDLFNEFKDYPNIWLVNPIYEPARLRAIRDRAQLYVHGHSAGGTNPSLVEMMHFAIPVLAYDCTFNRYTTENKAEFFDSEENLLKQIEAYKNNDAGLEMAAIARASYSWRSVSARYVDLIRRPSDQPKGRNWFGKIGIFCLLATLMLALAGCGALYNSPSVWKQDEDFDVSIVPMNFATVAAANGLPYVPRQIPDAFYQHVPATPLNAATSDIPLPTSPNQANSELVLKLPPEIAPMPYRIGVGDVVSILSDLEDAETTRTNQELFRLHNSFRVHNDGTISVPSIGTVAVNGLTLTEAKNALFSRLTSQGIDPKFSLDIREFNSQGVSIGGAVGRPGRVAIKLRPLRLNEALTEAAGIRLREDRFAIIFINRAGQIYTVPVKDFKARADLQTILLSDGDSVFVEENYDVDRALAFFEREVQLKSVQINELNGAMSRLTQTLSHRRNAIDEQRRAFDMRHTLDAVDRDYVYIAGEVEAQARFTLPYGRQATLADALFSKGGFNVPYGDPSEIYLLRVHRYNYRPPQIVAYHLDSTNAARLVLAAELELRPSDVIFVEEQPIAKWERSIRSVFNIDLVNATK